MNTYIFKNKKTNEIQMVIAMNYEAALSKLKNSNDWVRDNSEKPVINTN